MYINKQSNPLLKGRYFALKMLVFAKSRTIWWFGCHGNLYSNNIIIFSFWILFIRCGPTRMFINYPYFCLHKQDNLLWNWSILWKFWRSVSSVAMETKIINILSFFIHGICKPDMGYLDTIYVVRIQLCCKKIIGFENGLFLVFWKLVSMVSHLLLGNTIQTAYFIFH